MGEGVKRVTFIPRHVAENCEPFGHALISIVHPAQLYPSLGRWPYVMSFEFDDVELQYGDAVLFDVDMAHQIIGLADGADEIVVHCEAGMSRSAAIAQWLADRRGYELWLHPDGIGTAKHYNRHVYKTLDAADGRDMAAYYAEMERQERMMGL